MHTALPWNRVFSASPAFDHAQTSMNTAWSTHSDFLGHGFSSYCPGSRRFFEFEWTQNADLPNVGAQKQRKAQRFPEARRMMLTRGFGTNQRERSITFPVRGFLATVEPRVAGRGVAAGSAAFGLMRRDSTTTTPAEAPSRVNSCLITSCAVDLARLRMKLYV